MEYQTNSRCKYLIALHLILVVKYRKQRLQGEVGDFVKLKIIEISLRSEFDVEEIEVNKDHIHVLLTISPTICAASYVRRIKPSNHATFMEQIRLAYTNPINLLIIFNG